jgi:hypothetical protein
MAMMFSLLPPKQEDLNHIGNNVILVNATKGDED